ncbi:MAG: MFS transporter [Gammaproteobacteria bacterium]|nr:MFS transporter [Gammaproteobacteria bacterium]
MSDQRGHRIFAAFRVKSYRYQWPADLLTSWAFEMETLILGWYVLVATESVFLLSLFVALQFGGTLLSPYIGTLADRISRRRLLMALRICYAVSATILATLGLSGALTTWHVFAVGIVIGLLRPSDLVVRNSLIGDTVPESGLTNAMGLSRTTMDSARIAGALAGAGLFSTIGFGASYVVVAVFYLASVVFTAGVAHGVARTAGSAWAEMKVGLRYVIQTPRIASMMWLAFLVNLTAFPLSHGLLPHIAKDIYGTDENGLAHLMAAYAMGAMVGSIGLAWSGRSKHASRIVVVFIFVWYAVLLVFAQADSKSSGLLLLPLVGFAQSLSMISMSVTLLIATLPEIRGRVMGVRMLAVYGLPIGLVVAGALVEQVGFPIQATLYAGLGLLMTAAIVYRWRDALWRTTNEIASSQPSP